MNTLLSEQTTFKKGESLPKLKAMHHMNYRNSDTRFADKIGELLMQHRTAQGLTNKIIAATELFSTINTDMANAIKHSKSYWMPLAACIYNRTTESINDVSTFPNYSFIDAEKLNKFYIELQKARKTTRSYILTMYLMCNSNSPYMCLDRPHVVRAMTDIDVENYETPTDTRVSRPRRNIPRVNYRELNG